MADTYTVERSTTIQASPASIYEQIADFRNWTAWSPWEDLDPQLQRNYSGANSGIDAVYSWSGNRKAGEGRMEITDAAEPSKVVIALDFLKPFKSRSTTSFALTPDGDATRVDWTMTGRQTLIIKLMGIFKNMDKMIGPDFERGLDRLKTLTEGTNS